MIIVKCYKLKVKKEPEHFSGRRFNGSPLVKKSLKALKPDIARGRSLKLVTAWEPNLTCQANGCRAMFAEQKEAEPSSWSSGGNGGHRRRPGCSCHWLRYWTGATATSQQCSHHCWRKDWSGWSTVTPLSGSRMLESVQNIWLVSGTY